MESTPSAYVCLMHPNVRRLGPGTCPKCGSELAAQAPRLGFFRAMASHPLQVVIGLLWMLATLAIVAWQLR
jgi:hypothetical protein